MVAFIPARVGSQRVPGKNIKHLAGHPLIAYSIAAAQASGVCDRVVVVANDPEIRAVGQSYGANLCQRPQPESADEADLVWLQAALQDYPTEAFAIVRCTSPFRSARSIAAAWASLKSARWADSTRAVTPWHGPHPAKMWYPQGKRIDRIRPVWEGRHEDGTPWHSSPTQRLKPVYVQTAGLEIGWTARTIGKGSIAGEQVLPYLLHGAEALDINTPEDWEKAEALAHLLPKIEVPSGIA